MATPVSIDPGDLGAEPVAASDLAPEGSDKGVVATALHGAADTATFGLFDKALQAALPSSLYAQYDANVKASQAANPLSNLAGEGAGLLAGGGVLGVGGKVLLRGLRAVPGISRAAGTLADSLALQKGQGVKNAIRMAATGGAAGGTTAALQGDDPTQIALSTVLGAAAGPVAGTVANAAGKLVSGASSRAWQLVADKIGEKPQAIRQAINNYAAVTGRMPSMPEVLGMASRGELRKVAAANPEMAESFVNLDNNPSQNGKTLSSIAQARDDNFKAAVDPIRGQIIPLSPGELDVLQSEILPAVSITKTSPLRAMVADDINKGGISVGAADTIRQKLRDLANSKPGEGYDELMRQMQQTAESRAPRYGAAMDAYRSDSRFLDGLQHGLSGKNEADVADGLTRASLATPEGQAGLQLGTVTKQGRDAISSVTPGTLSPADTASQMGHAAGGALAHSPAVSAYHLSRLAAARLNLPPAIAQRIGQMLSDPSQTTQAVKLLQRAGARAQDIRNFALGSAAMTGSQLGNTQGSPYNDITGAGMAAAQGVHNLASGAQ